MSKNLSKTLGTMEAHIDDALASMTIVFNVDRYALIQSAYQMLGKTEVVSLYLPFIRFHSSRLPPKNFSASSMQRLNHPLGVSSLNC
jgi:hypothetical protein